MFLTLRLSVLYGLYGPSKILRNRSRVTEVKSVYCAVRSGPLNKTEKFLLLRVNILKLYVSCIV